MISLLNVTHLGWHATRPAYISVRVLLQHDYAGRILRSTKQIAVLRRILQNIFKWSWSYDLIDLGRFLIDDTFKRRMYTHLFSEVHEHGKLEVDTLPGPQPVEVPEHLCDVLVARWTVYQSGGSVNYRVESTELRLGKPRKCRVALVEAWRNERYNQRLQDWISNRTSDAAELS